VVSGRIGDELHISVRNVGYVRAAGDVVPRRLRRARARRRPSLDGQGRRQAAGWRAAGLAAADQEMADAIAQRFLAALRARG
jgi:hypothetical protein